MRRFLHASRLIWFLGWAFAASAGAATFTQGDLILAVRSATEGKTLMVNLGSATSYRDFRVFSNSVVNIGADLDAHFAGWQNRADVNWSIFGVRASNVYAGVVEGDPGQTIYISRAQPQWYVQSRPWGIAGQTINMTNHANAAVIMSGVQVEFMNGTPTSFSGATVLDDYQTLYDSYGKSWGGAFAANVGSNTSTQGNFGDGTLPSVLDLYRSLGTLTGANPPGALRVGSYVGTFWMDDAGNVGFAPFADRIPGVRLEVKMGGATLVEKGAVQYANITVPQNVVFRSMPGSTMDLVFTVTNYGSEAWNPLGGGPGWLYPGWQLNGTDAAHFSLVSPPSFVGRGQTVNLTVRYGPADGGEKEAVLRMRYPFSTGGVEIDIPLKGQMLSSAEDTDGDGLNDLSEFQMVALGFDWQVGQTSLVNTLTANLNGAGYFRPAQVQALHVGTPLIQRNPMTGAFTLTLGIEKSTDLTHFSPFPMTLPQMQINGEGKAEFRFSVPDDAAFFKVSAD